MLKYVGIVLLLFGNLCLASTVSMTPVPDWVTPQNFNRQSQVQPEDISGGKHYLLLDWQNRIDKAGQLERFRHYVIRAVNPEGTEDLGQFNFSYDPTYQQFELHQLIVWRDGKAIDKRKSVQIKVLQQENDLGSLLYNGEETANLLVDDIRINDVIEYSYSINGANPVFEGAFAWGSDLSWNSPAEVLYIRQQWDRDDKLYYKVDNSDVKVEERTTKTGREYVIDIRHTPIWTSEGTLPSWFEGWGSVSFSNVADWAEVVRWGTPMFDKAIDKSKPITDLAAKLTHGVTDKGQQIANILQYVQNEVRYLGIEFGTNSHRPSPALETLGRHYGDCKDKVVLLLSLLDAVDVKGVPALVNTDVTYALDKQIPAYPRFDHVIAKVEHDGKAYWLDPTRTFQSGGLDNIFQPDYRFALLLDGKSTDLEAMNVSQARSMIEVSDLFDLTDPHDDGGRYQSQSVYSHKEADLLRRRLADSSLREVRNDFLSFYQNYYDKITVAEPLTFDDNTANNTITASELYRVEDMWSINDDGDRKTTRFYANLISPEMDVPDDLSRTMPLRLDVPVDVRQTITARLEEREWSFDDEVYEKDNAYFYFKRDVKYDEATHTLVMDFSYRHKTSFVPSEDYEAFRKDLKEAKRKASFGIRKSVTALDNLAKTLSDAAAKNLANSEPATDEQTVTQASEVGSENSQAGAIESDEVSIKEAEETEVTESPLGDEQGRWSLMVLIIWLFGLGIATSWWLVAERRAYDMYPDEGFYNVSSVKFALLFVLSFGLYGVYWFYRNWLWVAKRDELGILPFWRGFFYPLWFYPFFKRLKADTEQAPQAKRLPDRNTGILLAIFLLVAFALAGSFEVFLLFQVLMLLVLLPLVYQVNHHERDKVDALTFNSRWSPATLLFVLLLLPLNGFMAWQQAGSMPDDTVMQGTQLSDKTNRFLLRKQVITPGEEVELFYSAGVWSFQEDGNGFSTQRVFSYWEDDDGFNSQTADFADVEDITVTWSKQFSEDTVIKVSRKDESSFLLFVSSYDGQDRAFVERLNGIWRAAKK